MGLRLNYRMGIKRIMNQKKFRKVLAEVINDALDDIEETDILNAFEDSGEIVNLTQSMDGDVFTNPEIDKLEEDAFKLIKQTIRNLQKVVTKEMPLWIISPKP